MSPTQKSRKLSKWKTCFARCSSRRSSQQKEARSFSWHYKNVAIELARSMVLLDDSQPWSSIPKELPGDCKAWVNLIADQLKESMYFSPTHIDSFYWSIKSWFRFLRTCWVRIKPRCHVNDNRAFSTSLRRISAPKSVKCIHILAHGAALAQS